ncbi:MAG: hypothetical protein RKR03_19125 [Candidatus Competibacter sp.]|nr:hypothetical protein [Candidatus Competibacter sp.]
MSSLTAIARNPQQQNNISVWVGALFIVGLFLIKHPYTGIRHDGILYTGQALLHLYPDNIKNDLFFAFGSQDNFTIFSNIYALVFEIAGPSTGTILILALSLLAFFGASFFLLKSFASGRHLWFGLFFLAGFSTYYGSKHIFSFAEPFLTARSVAEPLCLFSLLLLLRGSYWAALALVIIAATFHPLIALPVLAIWWIFRCLNNPKWWWLGGIALILPLMAAFGVTPFNQLFNSFDREWLSIIEEYNNNLFILLWNPNDWFSIIYDIVILALVLRHLDERQRFFLKSVIAIGIGGIIISLVGADIINNVFLTGLQLWRSQWIMHYFAVSLTPLLASQLLRQGDCSILAAWLLVTALISINHPVGFILIAIAMLLILINSRHSISISKQISIMLKITCLIIVVAISFQDIKFSLAKLDAFLPWWDRPANPYLSFAASTPFAIVVLLGAFYWLSTRRITPSSYRLAFVLFILTFSIFYWDQRTSWAKFVENGLNKEHQFKRYIASGNQVYWQNNLLSTWLLLQRPNYYANFQAAGLVFNRATAMEYAKRDKVFEIMVFQEQLCGVLNLLNNNYACELDIEAVREVCQNSPKLDFLILQSELKGFVEDKWVFKPEKATNEIPFYLYTCNKFRQPS